jgi:mannose-6-phosphate isomerase-like protein (cupin superfamily)
LNTNSNGNDPQWLVFTMEQAQQRHALPHNLAARIADIGGLHVKLRPMRASRSLHTHLRARLYFILQGCSELQIDDRRRSCSAGQVIYVSSGIPHRFLSFSGDFSGVHCFI